MSNPNKLPDMEAGELLLYLVRPVQDLEKKFDKDMGAFKELVQSKAKFLEGFKEYMDELAQKVSKLENQPNKLEKRVNDLENQCQSYKPLPEELACEKKKGYDHKMLLDDHDNKLEMVKKRLLEMAEDLKMRKCDVDAMKPLHDKHDKMAEEHARELCNLWGNAQEAKQFVELKFGDCQKEMNEMHRKFDNEVKDMKMHQDDLNRKLDQNMKEMMRCMEDLKKEMNLFRDGLKADMEARMQDCQDRCGRLEQKLDREDERFQRLDHDMELLEKRCDKQGEKIKELKAELGV